VLRLELTPRAVEVHHVNFKPTREDCGVGGGDGPSSFERTGLVEGHSSQRGIALFVERPRDTDRSDLCLMCEVTNVQFLQSVYFVIGHRRTCSGSFEQDELEAIQLHG
jgi:hypothetical protein